MGQDKIIFADEAHEIRNRRNKISKLIAKIIYPVYKAFMQLHIERHPADPYTHFPYGYIEPGSGDYKKYGLDKLNITYKAPQKE